MKESGIALFFINFVISSFYGTIFYISLKGNFINTECINGAICTNFKKLGGQIMKKLLQVLVLLTVLIYCISIPAFAASGKAIVPPGDFRYFSASLNYNHMYFVSNITNSPITVKITIFGKSGSVITTGISGSSNVTNFTVNPGDCSVSFDLDANATGYVTYSPTTQEWGYATIEWSQDSSAPYGLIADVKEGLTGTTGYGIRTLAVNNGMPF